MSNVATPELSTRSDVSNVDSHALLKQTLATLDKIIVGKTHQNKLAVACLLANGHLLIEDLPGVGKTTMAHALAVIFNLDFQRIQFTSDLLPADVTGVSIYDKQTRQFTLHRGPIFSQLVLADEINRATPKTQSALLEAMEERQVSVDGTSHALPSPFFVVATQNPTEQIGTHPLPESQLDRFTMRISLGYPERTHERQLLIGQDRRQMLSTMKPCLNIKQLVALQQQVDAVHVEPPLLDYLQNLLEYSRNDPGLNHGISPRAALVLLKVSKAWAFLHQHNGVRPADLKQILPAVVDHRIHFKVGTHDDTDESVSAYLLRSVAIP